MTRARQRARVAVQLEIHSPLLFGATIGPGRLRPARLSPAPAELLEQRLCHGTDKEEQC